MLTDDDHGRIDLASRDQVVGIDSLRDAHDAVGIGDDQEGKVSCCSLSGPMRRGCCDYPLVQGVVWQ